jgi:ATP-binding cassette subfamily B multidrug efflux pump
LRGLLRYGRFLRPDLWLVAGLVASLAAGTGLGLVGPYTTGLMVTVIRQASAHRAATGGAAAALPPALVAATGGRPVWELAALSAVLLLSALGSGVFQFLRGYLAELLAQRSVFRARAALFEHLQRQSFDFFDRNETGQLLSRATGDVEVIRRLISRAAPGTLAALFQLVGTAVILFRLDASLAALSVAVAPAFVWVMLTMSARMRPVSWALQQQLADLTTILQEVVSSIRVVKAFVRGPYEEARFGRANGGYLERSMELAHLQARYQPVLNQLPTLGTVFILGYGGLQVIGGHLSLGMFVAFNTYILGLLGPLRVIAFLVNLGAQAAAAADRIFEILDAQGSVQPPPHPVVLPRLRGEVRWEGVWARYRGSEEWVLRGVDLHVRPGECVALVGMTGAGKSTLVHLLPRFYDPERGRVLVDGYDVRTVDLRSLRSQIGFVLQDPFLFSATIEDNIRYGRPDAPREAVLAAARAAHVAEFAERLPQGYQTVVGERGVGLSGGQKQRVAIARALLLDPRILVLDDATSSVDAESEHLIWDALRRLMAGRTSLIIAHRLATVRLADRIVVLEDGRVAAVGTHDELRQKSALYRTIYELQLAPAERGVAHGGLLA